MEKEVPKAIKAKCTKCGYEWTTLSQAFMVSCPRCLYKTQIRKYIFLEEQNAK